ncbi:MAG: ATP-binding cassette domain-containing protein, partial [Xanthomonadales bacterium]|nr:ATP-binding cassette domain-containing protein [Xanthomonadales bacterium]
MSASKPLLFQEASIYALLKREPRLPLFWAAVLSLVNALATLAIIHDIHLLLSQFDTPQPWMALRFLFWLSLVFVSYLGAGTQISRLGCRAMMRFRQQLAAAVLHTDYQQVEQLGLARINAAFSEDLPRLGVVFTSLPGLLLNGLLVILAFVYLAVISWQHFLLTLVLVLIAIAVSERFLLRRLGDANRQFRLGMQNVLSRVHALVYGKKELSFNQHRAKHYLDDRFHTDLQQLYDRTRRRDDYQNLYSGWSLSISLFIMAAVLLCAQWFLPMSLAVMSSYVLLLLYLRGPVIFLINHVPHWISAQVALHSLGSLQLNAVVASNDVLPSNSLQPIDYTQWQRLDFVDLRYQYPPQSKGQDDEHRFALAPVTFGIERGEVVFISGGNGRGKSTLLKLISGLYPSSAGAIYVDQERLQLENIPYYQSLISTVLDGFYVFDDAFQANQISVSPTQLKAWIQQFQLPEQRIAEGQHVDVHQWSQGQRKRLALIAALAEDRDLLLLDEWAAEQDPMFRRYFYE